MVEIPIQKKNRSQTPYKPNTRRLLVSIYIMIAVLAGTTVASMNIPSTINLSSKYLPSIAVDGQNVYLAWINSTSDHYKLQFKKSSDGGRTFEKVTTLAKDVVGQPSNPKINIYKKT
jgi:hypothetical protein